ncbi:WD40 repeat domain-containing protein [Nocardiopsis sp. RSe5-2]|uniref:WD40 repeat domain-containing protein n=1 Tax=Nocardiopsis endophytica TaxID=3018445 RepID=A0ABT4U8V3_9ACTN|nr:WD40 repeat domain-containing protein [Nocardiopsis endophytica]MDA2812840.1 WD40 repeat domain-containing protein [Nocardiopsis endophytica]
MTELLLSSRIPSGVIDDFDLVTVDGRLLLCAGDGSGGCTWDPAADRWTEHRLDLPYRPEDFRAMTGHLPAEDDDGYRLYSVCAAVVDGRIVIGGGNYEEPFAQWDLATGAVRAHARNDDGGTGKTMTVRLDGRPHFIACGASAHMWDVERPDAEPVPLPGSRDTVSGIAAGTVDGRPSVVIGDWDGDVLVWDVETRSVFTDFRCPVPVRDLGLATLDGRTRIVVAGEDRLVLGDPDTGEWEWDGPVDRGSIGFGEEDEEAEDPITRMDVGVANGRPVAVTGSGEGRVCVWSLDERRLLNGPLTPGHKGEVNAFRIADLDGRTVAVSAGHDRRVLVWDLEGE